MERVWVINYVKNLDLTFIELLSTPLSDQARQSFLHSVRRQIGMTPLMLGCRLGHGPVVQMLIEDFGAELNLADKVTPNNRTQTPQRHITSALFIVAFLP